MYRVKASVHYKLTVVEDTQDQGRADYTIPRNAGKVENLGSKPNRCIKCWVTTVICGCRNMSLAVTDGGRGTYRAGKRRGWSKQAHSVGWQPSKSCREARGNGMHADFRDLDNASPRQRSAVPMPDIPHKLLKTYIEIYTDTNKSAQIINCLNHVLWWKKYVCFPSIYLFLAIKSADKVFLQTSTGRLEGVVGVHIIADNMVTAAARGQTEARRGNSPSRTHRGHSR